MPKTTTPDAAVAAIASGTILALGAAHAHPPALLAALAARARAGDVRDLTIYYNFAIPPAGETWLAPELAGAFRRRPSFMTAVDRALVAATGTAATVDYVPGYLHQLPRFFTEVVAADTFMAVVSPMDRAGWMSFGTSVAYSAAAARRAKRVIVEVNEAMPRTHGDTAIHVSDVHAVVEHSAPLVAVDPLPPGPEDRAIGAEIAKLIPDGATIQLGVGGVPDAVAASLRDHEDLGIHTELFSPGMLDLIERGVVTGARKRLHPRKHVFTIALGDRRLYDFLHDNPGVEGQPCDVTNDPMVIAQHDDMVSINSILEVDLFGQVNAEFLADHEFSGVGGQHDFVRGAYRSRGGKSFLAFHSTAHGGTVSRVVPRLGGLITDPRMDVHYLATEQGIVDLKGRSTRERAELIVSIAHPKFRDELLREAQKHQLL
jgi:itaconate CoA-transferase